jgi:uncharacterized protein
LRQSIPFHLSIPVADLEVARAFYERVLGARTGRITDQWIDVILFGHQITLQARPDAVLALSEQGGRHFGVILPWAEWAAMAEALERRGVEFVQAPHRIAEGTPDEHAKFYLADPSDNLIEIKTYRDPEHTLHL